MNKLHDRFEPTMWKPFAAREVDPHGASTVVIAPFCCTMANPKWVADMKSESRPFETTTPAIQNQRPESAIFTTNACHAIDWCKIPLGCKLQRHWHCRQPSQSLFLLQFFPGPLPFGSGAVKQTSRGNPPISGEYLPGCRRHSRLPSQRSVAPDGKSRLFPSKLFPVPWGSSHSLPMHHLYFRSSSGLR